MAAPSLPPDAESFDARGQFFQFAPGLHCTLDASLLLRDTSPDFARVLGWHPDDLRVRPFLELLEGEGRQRAEQRLRALEHSDSSTEFNAHCVAKDGRLLVVAWAFRAQSGVIYGSGRPVVSEVALSDTGPDSNSGAHRGLRLRAILESMEEGVIVQDRSGHVISSNAAAERILRADDSELQEQSAFGPPLTPLVRRDGTPFPDEERPAAQVLRTGQPVTEIVMGLRMPDGTTTWITANATPLRTGPGAPLVGVVLTIREITEQIRLQEALEASLLNYRSLVASLPVGVAVSHGRTMRYVNRALVDILGYGDVSELEGNETLMVVHPNSTQAILERYAGMAAGKHPGPGILECRRKDGSAILVEVVSIPSTFEGKPAVLALIRDVTESARARQAEERSDARFRALVGFAPVAIFETDRALRCVYANERMTAITGLSNAEIIQNGFFGVVHHDDLAALQRKWSELVSAGASASLACEVRFVGARGVVFAEARSVPLIVDGEVSGYLGALVDITEQKAAQAALAKSEESFRTLAQRAPIGIGVRDGNIITFANRALAEMFGLSTPADLVGIDVVTTAAPASRAELDMRVALIAKGERVPRQVFSRIRPDGTELLFEVDSLDVDFAGVSSTMSLIRDVTELERTRAERDTAHAALIESLGQKETLLKEIHHRVKNNLQVIASLLRLGRRYVKDSAAESVFEDSIARVHTIGLIHERLYQSHDLDRIEIADYLQGLVTDLIRANATRHRVSAQVSAERLSFEVDRCVPIGLIVNELVSNALKHAFGASLARAPSLVVSLGENGDDFELVVRDNGLGIDVAKVREGSLGLRLVASLAKQLGGASRVENREGTVWYVSFPKRRALDE